MGRSSASFTRLFAQRLDKLSKLTVVEGRPCMPLEPGLVVIAPGDFHLLVVQGQDGPTISAPAARSRSLPRSPSCPMPVSTQASTRPPKTEAADRKSTSQVVEAMTTNETSWFRDHHPFNALESIILPDLLRRRATVRRLTIWSAATASGQEAYSIAMVLHDLLAANPAWDLRVLATDLSEEMVSRTKAGRYSQLEINRGLPAAKLVRHFTRSGTEWQVNQELRRMVEVRQLNLAAPFPPLPPVDVMFLRNVLIYFQPDTRRQIFDQVRRVLQPDGYVVLGGAETADIEAFERVPLDKATVYRIRGGQAAT